MTTTTPPPVDPVPIPDPDVPPGPVSACPLVGEVMLPAETVPTTIGHARQSIVTAFADGHLHLLDDRVLLAVCEQAFRTRPAPGAVPRRVRHYPQRTAGRSLAARWQMRLPRVEPATNPHTGQLIENPRRWEVRLDHQGLPDFLPPRTHDYQRTPRMDTRYTIAAYQR